MPGPPPKPDAIRRNKVDTGHLVQHEVDPKLTKLFKRDSYHVGTQRWFDTWASSEQSIYFSNTDWQRLQMLAPLVEELYTNPRKNKAVLMAEIRQNESLLGATIMDRMRMRTAVAKAPAGPPPIDTSFEDDDELYNELNG